MKKRALSFLLVLAMIFSLAMPVYADNGQPEEAVDVEEAAEPVVVEESSGEEVVQDALAEEEDPTFPGETVVIEEPELRGEQPEVSEPKGDEDGNTRETGDNYTITFNANGGHFSNGEEIITIEVTPGESIGGAPDTPVSDSENLVWDGYWYFTAACDGDKANVWDYYPDGDVTYYAGWKTEYTVTIHANGGFFEELEGSDTFTTLYTDDFWLSCDIGGLTHSDPHMKLTGLYSDEACTQVYLPRNNGFRVYNTDLELYAGWEEGYLITFDGNGGFIYGDETRPSMMIVVSCGERINDNPTVYNADRTMMGNGWYTGPDGTGVFIKYPWEYIPTSDMTLYANLVPVAHLTLHANGGYFWSSEQDTYEVTYAVGERFYGGNCVPNYDGDLVFNGWYADPECTQLIVAHYDDFTITGDMDLYAGWVEGYHVTFHGNGGYFWGDSQVVSIDHDYAPNDSFYANNDQPKHPDAHKAFTGWYLDDACTQLFVEAYKDAVVTEDMDLYAGWADGYIVTFNGNGGFLFGSDNTTVYETVVLIGSGVKEIPSVRNADGSMEGRGWFLNDPNGELIREVYNYVPTSDVTFYARLVDVYHITLNANGGWFWEDMNETTTVSTVEQGEEIYRNWYSDSLHYPNGEKVFEGWYLDSECTQAAFEENEDYMIPQTDMTLYAGWKEPQIAYLGVNSVQVYKPGRQDLLFTPDESGYYVLRSSTYADKYFCFWDDGSYVADGGNYNNVSVVAELQAGTVYQLEVSIRDDWTGELLFTIEKVDTVYTITLDANGGFLGGPETTEKTLKIVSGDPTAFGWYVGNLDESLAFAGWLSDEGETIGVYDLYNYVPSRDMTLQAQWVKGYIVTFNGNGGFIWAEEGNTEWTKTIVPGTSVDEDPYVRTADGKKAGKGWYLNDPNGDLIRNVYELVPDGDITLYARLVDVYNVTFDANGGWFCGDTDWTTMNVDVTQGDWQDSKAYRFELQHSDPKMAFAGWCYDRECTQLITSDTFQPTGDMTVYAKWEEGWIVTLDGNGGKIWDLNGELVDQLQIPVAKGLAVGTSFSVETDEDHSFRGYWYADSEMTGARIDLYNYRPSSDVTLYAGILPCYEVTFHAGEGYFRTEDIKTYSEKIAKGELIGKGTHGVEISDPHKTLDGWYLDAALTQAADLNKYTVDGPVDLYAKWTQGWTVTFHMPRGDRSFKVKDGAPLSTAVAEPVVAYSSDESQSFAYWCYDQAGNNPVENVYAVLITRDFDFYPSWTESVTITWKNDSWESKQTIKKGSYTEFAPGHVWYWDSDCTKPADPFSVKMDEDVTFYMPSSDPAKCVNVTFDLNGGIFSDGSVVMKNSIVVTVMKGQPLQDEAFSTPYFGYNADTKYKKDGCALEGWTLTKNGTDFLDFSSTFTKDTTVYAKWTDAHTVTFDGNGKRIRLGYYDSADYVNSFTLNVKIEDSIAGCLEKAFYDLIFDETDEWVVEGWYYDSACTRPLSSTDTAKQTTLYAKWVKPCTLTFDFNGGFGYNDTLKAIPGKPLRNGMYAYSGDDRYIQTGWSTDRAGTSPIEEIWNYVPNGDVTLYAQWAKGYRINFVSEYPFSGGYYSNRIEVFDGDSIGNVSWLDYGCDRAIIGWYYDRALTRSAGDVSKLIPTESLTLYAEWGDKSPLPVIKTQPTDQTVGVGKTATFKVVAEDADSYQWYYLAPGGEWTQVSSAAGKTATYSFTAAERHNGYQYCCVISNKSGEIETDVVTLTVVSKPIISLTTPSDITVVEGQSATFVVYAENAVSYQWQYQKPGTTTWTNVSTNGTDPWYTLSAAELRHDGYKYRCTATNPAGTTTGDPVSLNVVEALAITAQPVDKSAKEGATVSFSVTAKGVKEYQWYFRVAEDADWIKASAASATTATYSVTTTAVHNGYQYYCHLTGKDGTTVDSNVVTLTVTAKPVVTTPSDVVKVAVYVGDPAEFEIGAIGEDLTYQWSYQKPGTSTWTNVSSNGTAAKYTLAAAELRHDGYKYRCTVKNAAGSATSPVFTLTVTEIFRITKQPTDVKVKEGATATFSVTATGVISYQWQYQKPGETTWTNVSATSGKTATYSFTTKASHEGNKYRCELISAEGPVYTDEATLTFLPKPVITQEPESISVEAGEKATFTVAADDATGYQWSYQKPGETSWTNVSSNGTSASYSLTAAARHSGYKYRCTVKNDAGSTVSAAATLTVEIVISAQPSVTPKDIGETAAFKVTATGASSYQWQYQKPGTSTWTNVSADSGKTANYTMTVKATHEGNTYRCELKNATETVYTDEVVLELKPKPVINSDPESISVDNGTAVTFTVEAENAESYQWYYQKPGTSTWTAVSAASGKTASYSMTAEGRHSGYKYRCTVKNGAGSVNSEAAELIVNIKIETQPASKTVTAGKTAKFTVAAAGATSYQWQYQKPGTSTWTNVSSNGTSASYSLTTAARHNGYKYRCLVKNATESVVSEVATLTVK